MSEQYRGKIGWVCPWCHKARNSDGCDPCFGNLPGVKYACCGHAGNGHCGAYIYFENGVRIGFVPTDIFYDDDRSSVIFPALKTADYNEETK